MCTKSFLDSRYRVSGLFFLCKAFFSNKSLSSAPLNQAPVPGCRYSSCVLNIHVCLCVCASVCACENVYVK